DLKSNVAALLKEVSDCEDEIKTACTLAASKLEARVGELDISIAAKERLIDSIRLQLAQRRLLLHPLASIALAGLGIAATIAGAWLAASPSNSIPSLVLLGGLSATLLVWGSLFY